VKMIELVQDKVQRSGFHYKREIVKKFSIEC
jgi:hypothetical protein